MKNLKIDGDINTPNLVKIPINNEHTNINIIKYYKIISLTLLINMIILITGILVMYNHINDSNTKLNNKIFTLQSKIFTDTNITSIYLKILILKPKIDVKLAEEIAIAVHKYSDMYKKNPNLILSIISIESGFDPKIVSYAGAEGLMQIMPFWKNVYKIDNFFDIPTSIKYGLQILSIYEEMYQDLYMALLAYNRGPGIIDASLRRGKDPTNGYAAKIMDTFDKLTELNVGDKYELSALR